MYILMEVSIEKRCFDVRRVHVHVSLGIYAEESAHGAELDNMRERLWVVFLYSLTESMDN
jgi:hypothetical protein